eukprot:scaffold49599_cov40-Prasinocladus_malaysianus.AAC.1
MAFKSTRPPSYNAIRMPIDALVDSYVSDSGPSHQQRPHAYLRLVIHLGQFKCIHDQHFDSGRAARRKLHKVMKFCAVYPCVLLEESQLQRRKGFKCPVTCPNVCSKAGPPWTIPIKTVF